jgi:hypothetical protein
MKTKSKFNLLLVMIITSVIAFAFLTGCGSSDNEVEKVYYEQTLIVDGVEYEKAVVLGTISEGGLIYNNAVLKNPARGSKYQYYVYYPDLDIYTEYLTHKLFRLRDTIAAPAISYAVASNWRDITSSADGTVNSQH